MGPTRSIELSGMSWRTYWRSFARGAGASRRMARTGARRVLISGSLTSPVVITSHSQPLAELDHISIDVHIVAAIFRVPAAFAGLWRASPAVASITTGSSMPVLSYSA
jgi:hypothetical protein